MRIRVSTFARVLLLASMILAVVLVGPVWAQAPPSDEAQQEQPSFETPADTPETVPGQIIVKFDEGAKRAEEALARRDKGLSKAEKLPLIDADAASRFWVFKVATLVAIPGRGCTPEISLPPESLAPPHA